MRVAACIVVCVAACDVCSVCCSVWCVVCAAVVVCCTVLFRMCCRVCWIHKSTIYSHAVPSFLLPHFPSPFPPFSPPPPLRPFSLKWIRGVRSRTRVSPLSASTRAPRPQGEERSKNFPFASVRTCQGRRYVRSPPHDSRICGL